jgi:hypothetical protein
MRYDSQYLCNPHQFPFLRPLGFFSVLPPSHTRTHEEVRSVSGGAFCRHVWPDPLPLCNCESPTIVVCEHELLSATL